MCRIALILVVFPHSAWAQPPGSGPPAAVVSILREAAGKADGVERDLILRRVSVALARVGEPAAALQTASVIGHPSIQSFAFVGLAKEFARSDDLSAIHRALAGATLAHHKSKIHRTSAIVLARRGEAAAAIRYAQEHLRKVDLAFALAGIVDEQVRRGDIAGAARTAERIGTGGYQKSAKAAALTAVAVAQFNAGDRVGAAEVLDKARREARRLPASDIKGSSPQAAVLGKIVLARAWLGDFAGAFRTIEDIDRGYFKVESLVTVADTQGDSGQRAEAERTLARAAEAAKALTERDWRSSALERVATAQSRLGEATGAQKTADAIPATHQGIYVKVRALAEVAVAYHTAGDDERATKTMSETLRLAGQMNDADYRKDWAITSIALAQARIGRIDTALETAASLRDQAAQNRTSARILLREALKTERRAGLSAAMSRLDDIRSVTGVLVEYAAASIRDGDMISALVLARALHRDGAGSQTLYYESWIRAAAGDLSGALETARSAPDAMRAKVLLGAAEGALGIAGEPSLQAPNSGKENTSADSPDTQRNIR